VSIPTPKPSVSAKPNKDTFQIDPAQLAALGGNGTSGSLSSVDWSSATFNAQGLGLTFPKTVDLSKVSAQQLYDTLIKAATTKEGQGTWLPLKYALGQSHYYSSMPKMIPGWGTEDKTAVTDFMTALAHKNSDGSNTPVANYLADQQSLASAYGGAATQIQKVNVPSITDLSSVADTAFRSALGRPPTAAEAKKFSVSYQQQVMANARASMAQTVSTPSAPISGAFTPKAGVPSISPATPDQAGAAIAAGFGKGPQTNTVIQQVQDVASPSAAAQDYARKAAPAEAGSENVSNALNAMFASLARNSQ